VTNIESLARKIIQPVHFKSAQPHPTVEDFKTTNILGQFWPPALMITANPMAPLYLFNYD